MVTHHYGLKLNKLFSSACEIVSLRSDSRASDGNRLLSDRIKIGRRVRGRSSRGRTGGESVERRRRRSPEVRLLAEIFRLRSDRRTSNGDYLLSDGVEVGRRL